MSVTCARCGRTAGSFLVEGDEFVCLRHQRHLTLVPDDPTPLEQLLLRSIAEQGAAAADGVNLAHDLLEGP